MESLFSAEIELFLLCLGQEKLLNLFNGVDFDKFLQIEFEKLVGEKEAVMLEKNRDILKNAVAQGNDVIQAVLKAEYKLVGFKLKEENGIKYASYGSGLGKKQPNKHNLSGIYGSAKKIRQLDPEISIFKNLKHLYLSENKIAKLDNLDFPLLTRLEVDSNLIRKIENIGQLSNLEYLSMSRNLVSKLENMKNLRKLETLNISNQKSAHLLKFDLDLETLPYEENSLSSLNMENVGLTDPSGLMMFPFLETLKLKNNLIEGLPDLLCMLENMKRLRCIWLENNPFTEERKWRDMVLLRNPWIVEMNGKRVTENEKRYLPELYARKGQKKKSTKKENNNIQVIGVKFSSRQEKEAQSNFKLLNS